MSPKRVPYNFGLSQEDERTEAAALELNEADRVLSVASAGDLPLSLLALGADRVEAVDIHPGQLQLCRLKAAAVAHLERAAALELLGFLPAPPRIREGHFHRLLSHLPPDAPRFWRAHRGAVRRGAIWAGRYERYVGTVVRLVLPVFGRRRVMRLFSCETLAQQRAFFDREVDRWALRAVFRVAFHPRIYARRGMDPTGLSQREGQRSLGEQFFEQFRWLCTATRADRNHLLQLTVLGRVLSPEAVPSYLSEKGFTRARARLRHLTFRQVDLVDHAREAPSGAFCKAHLSNVVDWLPPRDFHRLLQVLADRSEREGRPLRVVWRFLHADRQPPASLADRVRLHRGLGRQLQHTDRFPFYGIVPADIG